MADDITLAKTLAPTNAAIPLITSRHVTTRGQSSRRHCATSISISFLVWLALGLTLALALGLGVRVKDDSKKKKHQFSTSMLTLG